MKYYFRKLANKTKDYLKGNVSLSKMSGLFISAASGAAITFVITYYFSVTRPKEQERRSQETLLSYAENLHNEGNVVQAIEACNKVLERISQQHYPIIFGKANKQKSGYLITLWASTERVENLVNAIFFGSKALSQFSVEGYPFQRRETLLNLGIAELKLSDVRSSQILLGNSKQHLAEALSLNSEQKPDEKTTYRIRIGLCKVYRKSSDFEQPEQNLRLALEFAADVISIPQPTTMEPEIRGEAFHCMGETYLDLFTVTGEESAVDRARESLNEAKLHYPIEQYPDRHAAVDHTLGNFGFQQFLKTNDESDLRDAIEAYFRALDLRSGLEKAKTEVNIANALLFLSDLEEMQSNLDLSLVYFSSALEVFTLRAYPLPYAKIHSGKGMAYMKLAEGDVALTNLKHALAAFAEAGRVIVPVSYPIDYAILMNNAGEAHLELAALEETSLHISLAIDSFEKALNELRDHPHPQYQRSVSANLKKAQARQ